MLELTKKLYRTLLPRYVRELPLVMNLKRRLLRHNWVYTADYYQSIIEGPAVRSATAIAESIVADLRPTSVIDVGCGTGALLEQLRSRGCAVRGLEYSDAGLAYCRTRNLQVDKFDLESDSLREVGTYDVAVSLEVAEHLPEHAADRYLALLTSLSPVVVFTAAQPGQGGTDHVNEQPPSYWITKFQSRGYELAQSVTERWKAEWRSGGTVQDWYYQNLMVFTRVGEPKCGVC